MKPFVNRHQRSSVGWRLTAGLAIALLAVAPRPASARAARPSCRLDIASPTLNVECLPAVAADGATVAAVAFGKESFSVRFVSVDGQRAVERSFGASLTDKRAVQRQVRTINEILKAGKYRSLEAISIPETDRWIRVHGLTLRVLDEGEQGVEVHRGARLLGTWKPPELAARSDLRLGHLAVVGLFLPEDDAFVLVASQSRDDHGQLILPAPAHAIVRLPPGPPRQPPIEPRLCSARAAALGKWLKEFEADVRRTPGLFPGQLGVRMIDHAGATPALAPIVELTLDKVHMAGESITRFPGERRAFTEQLASVADSLARSARSFELLHPGESGPRTVAIAVDRDVPWQSVVALTGRIPRAGYDRIDWLFSKASPSRQVTPPKSPIDEDLAEIARISDPSRKTMLLAETSTSVLADCTKAAEFLESLAAMAPDMRLGFVVRELPSAILACNCAVDTSSIMALFYGVWGMPPSAKTYSAVSMRLADPKAKSPLVVSAPARAPWSATYRLVVDAAAKAQPIMLRIVAR